MFAVNGEALHAAEQVARAGGLGSDVPAVRPGDRGARHGTVACMPHDCAPGGTATAGCGSGQLELRLLPPLLLVNALPCRLAWRLDSPAAMEGNAGTHHLLRERKQCMARLTG